ncbi:hypothetical protein GKD00_02600 [Lactobacillus ruminis]|nr:hypothetical protein [Ligilactobacillus ruminis]MSB80888.1 hypothetical protein [Ligilactobacillus ruminis]
MSLEKSSFYSLGIIKAGQSQPQIDRLRSAFHRNGTFFPASFVIHSKIRLSFLFDLSKAD